MKKNLLTLLASALITGTLLISCNNSAEKVENAESNATEAMSDLNEANEEYLAEIEEHKKKTADKITANEKSIAEYKERIENERNEIKADYNKKIYELEKKNSDIKKKMDDYQAEGKEKWELFKAELNRDIEDLGNAIGNFFS